jgi:putative membrane protein
MTQRGLRTFQTLVLAALGLFLFWKVSDGTILMYINKRYVILIFLASLGLVILSQVLLKERQPETLDDKAAFNENIASSGQKWNLWWLALPVILGILVPARPLGAAALANRGVSAAGTLSSASGARTAELALKLPENQRTLLDWIHITSNVEDLQKVNQRPIDVIGFVYHDPRLQSDHFLVGRFAITCCVADAFAIGLGVSWPQAADLPDNQWVRIQGVVGIEKRAGQDQPVILAKTVEKIPEPEQPYLFP